jgi:hypothetical protein
MENRKSHFLIDGTFNAKESLEILKNLFKSKIQFHSLKNFSSQERFGISHKSEHRIEELTDTWADIKALIEKYEDENVTFEIQADIKIKAVEDKSETNSTIEKGILKA